MKIIDEKGRLFGKFNLFDLVIILLILLVITALYIKIMFPEMIGKFITDIPEQEYVIVKVILPQALYFLKEYINIGDSQKRIDNKVSAKIIDIKEINGQNLPANLLVTFKVLATKERGDVLVFGRNILKIGNRFIFQTPEYTLQGYVKNVSKPR